MSIKTPNADFRENLQSNWIINGDMLISERGSYTSATAISANIYSIDRWKSRVNTVTATVQSITTAQPEVLAQTYSIKYAATSTATGSLGGYQAVEYHQYFQGKTLTFSAWVKSNSSEARLFIFNGSAFDGFSSSHSGSGNWEKLTVTCDLNAAATELRAYAAITSSVGGTVSISSGDYIEFTGAKLEFGSEATEFVPRPINIELQLCQRYFYRRNGAATGSLGTVAGNFDTGIMLANSSGLTSANDTCVAYSSGYQTFDAEL